MKILIAVVRVLVGLLFIFSGLVKANDPQGLSYKMKEFFEVWNEGLSKSTFFLRTPLVHLFEYLHEHSLTLSVIMIAVEIIAGVALLVGWRMKAVSWLLLLLILFFTFLTGYAYLSGKFKNCGCFGDCLPITPFTSFLKDIVLTGLILFLFYHRKKITAALPVRSARIAMLVTAILSFGIQAYALVYLPYVDCLPFKKGNNISEQMKIPPGAVPDSFAIRFVYEKGGKEYEFSPAELPADLNTYQFKKRTDKLVRKGNAEPPVKGFALTGAGDADSTAVILSEPWCVLLFDEKFDAPVSAWQQDFSKVYAAAKSRHIPVYIVTTVREKAQQLLSATPFRDVQVFNCDYTVIRMAARANPCLYVLQQGTITGKWGPRQLSGALRVVDTITMQQPLSDSTTSNSADTGQAVGSPNQ
jgi:uncharacterized membrane protein YphA (DoxX/SURF4 family)